MTLKDSQSTNLNKQTNYRWLVVEREGKFVPEPRDALPKGRTWLVMSAGQNGIQLVCPSLIILTHYFICNQTTCENVIILNLHSPMHTNQGPYSVLLHNCTMCQVHREYRTMWWAWLLLSKGWAQQAVTYFEQDFTISMTLTSSAGSGTDCSAGPAEYGWMLLQTWVSLVSDTWSSSERISGGRTWL